MRESFPDATTQIPWTLRAKVKLLEILHPWVHTKIRIFELTDGELIDRGFGCRICHRPLR